MCGSNGTHEVCDILEHAGSFMAGEEYNTYVSSLRSRWEVKECERTLTTTVKMSAVPTVTPGVDFSSQGRGFQVPAGKIFVT